MARQGQALARQFQPHLGVLGLAVQLHAGEGRWRAPDLALLRADLVQHPHLIGRHLHPLSLARLAIAHPKGDGHREEIQTEKKRNGRGVQGQNHHQAGGHIEKGQDGKQDDQTAPGEGAVGRQHGVQMHRRGHISTLTHRAGGSTVLWRAADLP